MDDKRLTATKFIWGTFGALLARSSSSPWPLPAVTLDAGGFLLVVLLIIAPAVSTVAVWRAPVAAASEQREKAKRSSRLTRLVDNLDDDENLRTGRTAGRPSASACATKTTTACRPGTTTTLRGERGADIGANLFGGALVFAHRSICE